MGPPTRLEVAILGAGVAGCATALALAAHGIDGIAIFDTGRRGGGFRIGESIPAAAKALLRHLDMLDPIMALRPLPRSGTTMLWGKETAGYNDAIFDPAGAGWHLDRAAFNEALNEGVLARGIPIFQPFRLDAIRPSRGEGYALSFAGGDEIVTRLLVDASGIRASASQRLNVARNVADVLTVFHAVMEVDATEVTTTRTFVEAVPYGWWYAARIPGNRMVTMLATDKASMAAASLSVATADSFTTALATTRLVGPAVAAARPGSILAIGQGGAPVTILSGVAGRDWVAAGDAAWSCDPLTSQGITKALADGIAAADALVLRLRGDRGEALRGYQTRVFEDFTANLRLRAALYEAEGRWPDAPFWRHRRVSGATVGDMV